MMLVIEQRKSVRCLHARWTEMGGAETVAGAESEQRARCALGGPRTEGLMFSAESLKISAPPGCACSLPRCCPSIK